MKGTVYKSTGSWYVVKGEDGKWYNARVKGKFRIDDITSTNPLTVGDSVDMEKEEDDGTTTIINGIDERKNYVNRQSPSHKHLHHIVAANLDQSLLMGTLRNPRTSQGFIDRFLVTCEAYHVPAIIVFNKADLYRDKEIAQYEHLHAIYESIGYSVFLISLVAQTGIDEVRERLIGKRTLISGHSGVGKSSFINAVFPEFDIRTQEVSGWSGKGMHTTTFAEMYDLPGGGSIIDTPGMREFGIVDITRQELSHYFPEMKPLIQSCRFNNCLHINEPGCAVKEAVVEGTIDEDRYVSYYNILESIEEKAY